MEEVVRPKESIDMENNEAMNLQATEKSGSNGEESIGNREISPHNEAISDEDGFLTDENPEQDGDRPLEEKEPGEDLINGLPFYKFMCYRLEKLWENKRKKRASERWKEKQRLEYILQQKMLDGLNVNNQTIYPYLRLLLPDKDSRRQFHVREKKIAEAYCKAQGFGKGTSNYEMLMNFTDPQKVPPDIAGDLSLVVEYVLKKRLPANKYSEDTFTIGLVNRFLDEFANLRAYSNKPHHNHGWREELKGGESNGGVRKNSTEKQPDSVLRANWLRRVMSNRLSPVEHKWLVRILQKKMEIGVGYVTILKHISPYAIELWNAHNNLQRICTTLADPTYTDRRRKIDELRKKRAQENESIWEPQVQPAELGNTLSPMISIRSSFEKLMTQTGAHHLTHLKKFYPASSKSHKPLSIQFPALSAEIKLDGERFIIHIEKGRVKMNTRNSKWFSELYGPVLGPSLRRALSRYPNLNVILDGEVESWDDVNKKLVPFGENRTVAGYRRAYCKHHGMIDSIDTEKLHEDNDETVMRTASVYYTDKSLSREELIERGKRFWLKFRAFDILYVNGSDKSRLYKDCGIDMEKVDDNGSTINLPLLNRKQILYQILIEQENEIEICPTVVIRCNGDVLSGKEYFSTSNPTTEFGFPVSLVDSTQAILQQRFNNLEDLDKKRRQGRTNSQISKLRAEAVENFYTKVVEEYKFEGLVVKDLASPYLFGVRKFWWKFKPDYETDEAVDIDVVIIGAKFATGLRNGGTPSGYLVGIVDKFDPNSYMTFNSVNAASTSYQKMEEILNYTGFKKGGGDEPMELGKWFREDDFGLPSFISKRSLQRNSTEDFDGWAFNKTKHYPDIWIEPKDSVVLTVKCAELVLSDEYSLGLSMRFPRIKKVRLESIDGDEKKASEISDDEEIWKMFEEAKSKRLDLDAMIGTQSHENNGAIRLQQGCRFLTPEEFRNKDKDRKRKAKAVSSPSRKIPKIDRCESNILEGRTFCVLEGVYSHDMSLFETRATQKEGWADEMAKVRSEEDVIKFIKRHGGSYTAKAIGVPNEYIIGGNKDDARVKTQINGLKYAKSLLVSKKKSDQKHATLARHHDGILKWSFVYYLVNRLQEEAKKISSMNDNDYDIQPEPHQYLVRVSCDESIEEAMFSLNRPLLVDEMEHILSTPTATNNFPWQYNGLVELPKEERWTLSSSFTSLWPYDSDASGDKSPVVVYPDVFACGFGFTSEDDANNEVASGYRSLRWESIVSHSDVIVSALPLVSSMGCIISPHLHSGITHIICRLKADVDSLPEGTKSADQFICQKRGRCLLDYVCKQFPHNNKVRLVSPNWFLSKLKI